MDRAPSNPAAAASRAYPPARPDRVVLADVEAEHLPALLHMRRQRRGDVEHAALGVRQDEAARQQVQLVLDAVGQIAVRVGAAVGILVAVAIFRVADDRAADRLGMGAQLMGAAGQRLHRQPGQTRRSACPPRRNKSANAARRRRHVWRRASSRCRGAPPRHACLCAAAVFAPTSPIASPLAR